jgi:nucleoside-diphosphate-sugar epimerase
MKNMTTHNPVWTPTLDPEDLNHILNHTSTLWEELRGQRIFITGGTGFFGHWLLESLLWINDILNLNVKVVLLSRNPAVFSAKYPQLANHPAVSWIQGDVKTFDFPEGEFPYIIHAAFKGDIKLAQEDPLYIFDTIVQGTHRVFELARTHYTRKFLFTSSGAVYGRPPREQMYISEDYIGAPNVMHPLSVYGEGKRAAELLCNLYSYKYRLETKIARCFSFVGPYLPLNGDYAIGNFIRDAIKGGPIMVKGDGTPQRSYLYAADLSIWLWTILIKGHNCRPYNVGSDIYLSIAEVAEYVAQQFHPNPKIEIIGRNDPNKSNEYYVPSVRRAKVELNTDIWIDLREAIRRTHNWRKAS